MKSGKSAEETEFTYRKTFVSIEKWKERLRHQMKKVLLVEQEIRRKEFSVSMYASSQLQD